MKYNINKELVVLVGPMGAGKTTIGKILARELGFDFYDSDHEIERRSGADIPWIFDVEGEAGFRDREANVIEQLTELKKIVLATGGGAMMRPENRLHVAGKGFVIYLNTSIEQQHKRTHKGQNRPLLHEEGDPYQVLTELYATRDPLYREVADLVVDTDRKSLKMIVKGIVHSLLESDPLNGQP